MYESSMKYHRLFCCALGGAGRRYSAHIGQRAETRGECITIRKYAGEKEAGLIVRR